MGTTYSKSVDTSLRCDNHALPSSTRTAQDEEEPEEPPSQHHNAIPVMNVATDVEEGVESIAEVPDDRHRSRVDWILRPDVGYRTSMYSIITHTPLNALLLCIPVSLGLHYTLEHHNQDVLTFVFSALGIIPLAGLLGLATEQVSLRTSDAIGGLVNASMGNVVEIIVAGVGLRECDIALVQSTLLGGLLSNLLLVLGMAFVVGGFRFKDQVFQPRAAQINASLMAVSVISLLVPGAFHQYLSERLQNDEGAFLLQMSRGSAIVLILIYIAYLFFQFHTHKDMFVSARLSVPLSSRSSRSSSVMTETKGEPILTAAAAVDARHLHRMNMPMAFATLAACTALAYFTAEGLIASLEGLVEHSGVSKEWITLIVIPIVSNAAEHATAVVVAAKGKFDLAIAVAVGSCVQIALFVIPLLVIVAWGLGKPLTLVFDPLETICLFLSVLIVKFSIEDGRSHWMNAVALIGVYVLIAIAFWDYPPPQTIASSALACF